VSRRSRQVHRRSRQVSRRSRQVSRRSRQVSRRSRQVSRRSRQTHRSVIRCGRKSRTMIRVSGFLFVNRPDDQGGTKRRVKSRGYMDCNPPKVQTKLRYRVWAKQLPAQFETNQHNWKEGAQEVCSAALTSAAARATFFLVLPPLRSLARSKPAKRRISGLRTASASKSAAISSK
jgi:hypothetical protein